MTDIDYDGLREKAEKATRGPWRWTDHRVPALVGRGGDPKVYEYDTEVIEAEHYGECGCRSACELNLNVGPFDAEFIAAANPQTVLALLDEMERLGNDLAEAHTHFAIQEGRIARFKGERDEALAVIERALEACASHQRLEGEALDVRLPDGEWDDMTAILNTDPADALRAVKAEAWDEGAKWAAVECGAIRHEANGFLAPGDNPYREEQS